MYTKEVLEHFKNPKNKGKIEDADGIGKVGNIVCGDVMWLYIKVKDDIIIDIAFETFGCVAAIATSSMITELAKGKTIQDALKINKQSIVDSLGGLPKIKIHCSVLAADALAEAIYDYLSKKKRPIPKELEKKHQRINKEEKLIKEKYKGWVDTEEGLREK